MPRSLALPTGNRFGKYLKKMRKRAGLTQEAFAKRIRTTNRYVSRMETGTRAAPNAASLILMADALGVPLSTFMVRAGLVPKCRHPEHLDSAVEALAGWRTVLDLTESARVLEETIRIFVANRNKLNLDMQPLVNIMDSHAKRLRDGLRVKVTTRPED